METKPWFASKTLWVNFVAVVAAMTGAFGIDLGLDPETQVTIVGAIMGVVNIILRFTTSTGIGSS